MILLLLLYLFVVSQCSNIQTTDIKFTVDGIQKLVTIECDIFRVQDISDGICNSNDMISIDTDFCNEQMQSSIYSQVIRDCYKDEVKNSTREILFKSGAAILHNVIDSEIVQQLRDIITRHQDFQKENQSRSGNRGRYFWSVGGPENDQLRKPWSTMFLDIMTHPRILAIIEQVLGKDALMDNSAVSVGWPSGQIFGPHLDRPFDLPKDVSASAWPSYSVTVDEVPPQSYPISLQVIVALDDFTENNGAFYYCDFGSEVLDYPHVKHLRNLPANHKKVLLRKGSIIIASGALPHGADINLSTSPRLAILLQYVRRFVRPARIWKTSLEIDQSYMKNLRFINLLDLT